MLQDLSYAVRQLLKSPTFTIVAVLAIALGIGANAAIFSVINAVLLRPLPYHDPDRLVTILEDYDRPVAPGNVADWRAQNHAFEDIGSAESWTANLSKTGQAESVKGLRVSPNLFPTLDVQPLQGRFFASDEDKTGKEHVVILSHGLWQRSFGGNADIVGQPITLQGQPFTVVGVMPAGFQFAPFWVTKAELWVPLALGPRATSREGQSLRAFARLKPGVSLEQARSEMATITARLEQQFPGTNRNITVQLLKDKVVGDVRPALLVLLAAVSFVLLIACANVAHLLMARGAARRREIAVRAALGADRWRIIRQFLTESLLLALLGGAAGLLLAFRGIAVLTALIPQSLPRAQSISLDSHVLLFTAAVSILTGVVFGVVPALQASDVNLRDALQEAGRGGSENLRHNRLRSVLVASEFALAFLLMIGAGLMVRTLIALRAIDPGFEPHHVLSAVVSVAGSEEAQPQKRLPFYQQTLERVAALPGVESVSAINHVPLAGDTWGFPFSIQGRARSRPGEGPNALYRVVLPGYFRTMGLSLVKGRDVSESDSMNAPGVVIINQRLARTYWPGEDAIGKRITLDDSGKNPNWLTVIGVAQDAKQDQWTAPPRPEMYLPLLQSHEYLNDTSSHFEYITLVVRTTGQPAAIANDIKAAVAAIDKNVPVSEIETLDEAVADLNAQPRFESWLLGSFAGLAVLLAALGIYGVMSYSVCRRTQELGVRMALGAAQNDVIRLVVRQAMTLALIGALCGLMAAVALTRLMSSFLYGVRPFDLPTYVAAAAAISGVALVAGYIPARRATRINPVTALRSE
jgi:putative ABC transport system permease protein